MNTSLKTIFVIALLTLCLPLWAAEVRVQSIEKDAVVGEEFLADVRISSADPLNAIEGTLLYPPTLLDIKEIRDGASVINFWIEEPDMQKEGEVSFSGITPGGFSGDGNLILSVLFKAKKEGDAALALSRMKVLLNDGAGTLASSTVSDTAVSIREGGTVPAIAVPIDEELPEDFTPILAHDSNLFDNKFFLVFATSDKISGIDYYELKEGRGGKWKKADSPYLLEDQSLGKKVFIRARDKAGNLREVVFSPGGRAFKYKTIAIFAIIALLLSAAYLVRKKLWRKPSN